jgi:hypothetical protein
MLPIHTCHTHECHSHERHDAPLLAARAANDAAMPPALVATSGRTQSFVEQGAHWGYRAHRRPTSYESSRHESSRHESSQHAANRAIVPAARERARRPYRKPLPLLIWRILASVSCSFYRALSLQRARAKLAGAGEMRSRSDMASSRPALLIKGHCMLQR